MDTLVWIFLESRIALGIILGLALFGLLVYWRRTLKPLPLLIGVAVAIVLLIVQSAVVTRREHAVQIMHQVELDVLDAKTARMAQVLSPTFHVADYDKSQFLNLVDKYQHRVKVHTVKLAALEFGVNEPDMFTIEVDYGANISVDQQQGPLPTSWMVRFVLENGEWHISEILPRSIGRQSVRTWQDLERF